MKAAARTDERVQERRDQRLVHGDEAEQD